MKRVILESPYAGDIARNVAYARACVRDSLSRDEAPIASHLLYTQEGILADEIPYERMWGIKAGLAWQEVAELHVFYIDYGYSRGMEYAKEYAKRNDIPIEERRLFIAVTSACPNCKEPMNAECLRNKCVRCLEPVGNITFTVCDECWDKNGTFLGAVIEYPEMVDIKEPQMTAVLQSFKKHFSGVASLQRVISESDKSLIKNKRTAVCPQCGSEVTDKNYYNKYCSKACYTKRQTER